MDHLKFFLEETKNFRGKPIDDFKNEHGKKYDYYFKLLNCTSASALDDKTFQWFIKACLHGGKRILYYI